jgi:hypothetical protein
MRKPRLIAAVLVVVGAGIFIYCYARRHAGGMARAANPPELVELAPADSTVLLYADVAALRSSAFVMRLATMVPPVTKDRDYAEFVRATGFDYERDLDRFVLAMQAEGKNAFTTAIADGHFDQNKIAAYALRTGKLETQTGGDGYNIPSKSSGKTVAIRFLNSNRIMLTDRPKLQPASEPLSSKSTERGNRSAPEMQGRIARVSGAPLFAVAKLDSAMQKKDVWFHDVRSEQFENLARSVRWLSLAARPEGDRVDLALDGECDTAENARQLAGTLDGLRIMGRMALSDPKTRRQMDPATLLLLGALLRGAEVSRDDQDQVHRVRLTLVISQKALGAGTAGK